MSFGDAYSDIDTMTLADKLASYGWVIGHEIAHGFDSTGSLYNASGTYSSSGIFSTTDTTAFTNRTALVTAAYQDKEPIPGEFTDGTSNASDNSAS